MDQIRGGLDRRLAGQAQGVCARARRRQERRNLVRAAWPQPRSCRWRSRRSIRGATFFSHRVDAVDCDVEIAGEARRRRPALTVLLISMVIVMGPTPPGTGLSAPATLTASGCTSP